MVSMFYPNGVPEDDSNLPAWMKAAIANVGQIGPGAASYVSTSGPQEFSKLLAMYNQSLGTAPTMIDESKINSIYDDAVKAAMQLGSEQIHSAEADRGAAMNSGVAQQQARELGLRVSGQRANTLLENLANSVTLQNSRLGKLFDSASGPQANSLGYRNTTQDINSQLPPYVQQSNPGSNSNSNSFSSPGGSAKPGGGSTPGGSVSSGTPWWQTSYGDMNGNEGAKWNLTQPKNLPPLDKANKDAGYYDDWWNQPGYPERPKEDQPLDKTGWVNYGSAPAAGNTPAAYTRGEGEWRTNKWGTGTEWWGAAS